MTPDELVRNSTEYLHKRLPDGYGCVVIVFGLGDDEGSIKTHAGGSGAPQNLLGALLQTIGEKWSKEK